MSSYNRISAPDALNLMRSETISIVDIRDHNSFRLGHIKNAKHLDNAGVSSFIQETDPAQPVLVCCYNGNSSQSAAAWLAAQGFEHTYSLDGGYNSWQLSYPAECEAG